MHTVAAESVCAALYVSLAHPEGYGLIPEVVELARQNSAKSGGKFQVVSSMEAAEAIFAAPR